LECVDHQREPLILVTVSTDESCSPMEMIVYAPADIESSRFPTVSHQIVAQSAPRRLHAVYSNSRFNGTGRSCEFLPAVCFGWSTLGRDRIGNSLVMNRLVVHLSIL
jgi:hypothetical protein